MKGFGPIFGKGSSVVLFSSSEIVSLRASWCPLQDCRHFLSEGPDFPLSWVFHWHPQSVKRYCVGLVKHHNDNRHSLLRDKCLEAIENQTPLWSVWELLEWLLQACLYTKITVVFIVFIIYDSYGSRRFLSASMAPLLWAPYKRLGYRAYSLTMKQERTHGCKNTGAINWLWN